VRQFLIAAVLGVGVLTGVEQAQARPAASKAACRTVCGAKIAADCSGLRKHKTAACKVREVRQCRKVGGPPPVPWRVSGFRDQCMSTWLRS
jgi:hypothetical protein